LEDFNKISKDVSQSPSGIANVANSAVEPFYETVCLSDNSKQLADLGFFDNWLGKADIANKRSLLDKFLAANADIFDFIDVKPTIEKVNSRLVIAYKSGKYVGVIPLVWPDPEVKIGDLFVYPRFLKRNRVFEYVELIDIVSKEIKLSVLKNERLQSKSDYRPIAYPKAIDFINSLEKLIEKAWRLFDNKIIISNLSMHLQNRESYLKKENDTLLGRTDKSENDILNIYHDKYNRIKAVFIICKNELMSPYTPLRIRENYNGTLNRLDEYLYGDKSKFTKRYTLRVKDQSIINSCARKADGILQNDMNRGVAWKYNMEELFSSYINYIFIRVSMRIEGNTDVNFHDSDNSVNNNVDNLKYQNLLHINDQLIAAINIMFDIDFIANSKNIDYIKSTVEDRIYADLPYTYPKIVFLCYPSNIVSANLIDYTSQKGKIEYQICVLGVPLSITKLDMLVSKIYDVFAVQIK
jgi:hypothetical protein